MFPSLYSPSMLLGQTVLSHYSTSSTSDLIKTNVTECFVDMSLSVLHMAVRNLFENSSIHYKKKKFVTYSYSMHRRPICCKLYLFPAKNKSSKKEGS